MIPSSSSPLHFLLRQTAVRLLRGVAFLLPAAAFAHEGEGKGPWIDFSRYGFGGLFEVSNVHPAFVHFPIALVPTMFLFYILGIWLKKPSLLVAGRVTLYLALASVALAVFTGMAARGTPAKEAIEQIMGTHKNTGIVILIVTGLLAAWSFWQREHRPRGAWVFLATAALASFLVLQNGDLGAKMVYLHGAGVTPMVEDFEGGGHGEEAGSGHHGGETPQPAANPAGQPTSGGSEAPPSNAIP